MSQPVSAIQLSEDTVTASERIASTTDVLPFFWYSPDDLLPERLLTEDTTAGPGLDSISASSSARLYLMDNISCRLLLLMSDFSKYSVLKQRCLSLSSSTSPILSVCSSSEKKLLRPSGPLLTLILSSRESGAPVIHIRLLHVFFIPAAKQSKLLPEFHESVSHHRVRREL